MTAAADALVHFGQDVWWRNKEGITILIDSMDERYRHNVANFLMDRAATYAEIKWRRDWWAGFMILADLDECWTGGRPVIIYNASFDLTLLDRELRRHCQVSLDGLVGTVIDPFVIDKELDRYRKGSRTLTAACEHYGVKLEGAHTAEGDALAAARVAWRLAQVYPEHLSRLEELNELQAMWRRDWAEQFTNYLAKKAIEEAGSIADVEPIEAVRGDWPLVPYSEQAAS